MKKKRTKKELIQPQIKIIKQVDYDTLKCLVVAAFLLGQETGLKGMTYNHPVARKYRDTLIDLIISPLSD